jgi:hypothetical protein
MWLVFGSRTCDNDNLNESHGHKGFFPLLHPTWKPRHRQTVESKGAVDLFLSSWGAYYSSAKIWWPLHPVLVWCTDRWFLTGHQRNHRTVKLRLASSDAVNRNMHNLKEETFAYEIILWFDPGTRHWRAATTRGDKLTTTSQTQSGTPPYVRKARTTSPAAQEKHCSWG